MDWSTAEVRGEITVVVGPAHVPEVQGADESAIDEAIVACLDAGLSARDTTQAVTLILGLNKRHVYARVNALSSE